MDPGAPGPVAPDGVKARSVVPALHGAKPTAEELHQSTFHINADSRVLLVYTRRTAMAEIKPWDETRAVQPQADPCHPRALQAESLLESSRRQVRRRRTPPPDRIDPQTTPTLKGSHKSFG